MDQGTTSRWTFSNSEVLCYIQYWSQQFLPSLHVALFPGFPPWMSSEQKTKTLLCHNSSLVEMRERGYLASDYPIREYQRSSMKTLASWVRNTKTASQSKYEQLRWAMVWWSFWNSFTRTCTYRYLIDSCRGVRKCFTNSSSWNWGHLYQTLVPGNEVPGAETYPWRQICE